MRAIFSTASILVEEIGPQLGNDHREILRLQMRCAVHFGALIDDLLAYSRLSRAEVSRRVVDVSCLVRRLGVRGEIQDRMSVWGIPR